MRETIPDTISKPETNKEGIYYCLEITVSRLLPLLAIVSWLQGAWLIGHGLCIQGGLLGGVVSLITIGSGWLWMRRKNRYVALAGVVLIVQICGGATIWLSLWECQQGRFPFWLMLLVVLLQGACVLSWPIKLLVYGLTVGWCGWLALTAERPLFLVWCGGAGALMLLISQDTYRRLKRAEKVNRDLLRLSRRDELTGLYNRREMDRQLSGLWDLCRRERRSLGVMMVDIDDFKTFNTIHGHSKGDRALRALAETVLMLEHGKRWFAARYEGDALVLLMAQRWDGECMTQARELYERWKGKEGDDENLTVSIGVYCGSPQERMNPAEWLEKSDKAMYIAKAEGKDRIVDLSEEDEKLAAMC